MNVHKASREIITGYEQIGKKSKNPLTLEIKRDIIYLTI